MTSNRITPNERLLIAAGLGKTYYKDGRSGKGFNALKDVSFTLQSGDVLGIIGRNGAGKSTLLQILSRIVSPDRGEVRYQGKIAAVLDVGTGFHPELSGRENIFLNGVLMGMTKEYIHSSFDEILAFSGIASFIDTPVKHYSSGMYVRLAFSIAAFLEADILLFDEVLAVGDMEFRLKVYERLKTLAKSGVIVVMAGHDLGQISQLCTRCLWLHEGTVLSDDLPSLVIEQYMESFLWEAMGYGALPPKEFAGKPAPSVRQWQPNEAPGNEIFRLYSAALQATTNNPALLNRIEMDMDFVLKLTYEKLQSGYSTSFYISVFHVSGNPVLSSVNQLETIDTEAGIYEVSCHFPSGLFNHGLYYIDVWVGDETRRFTLEFKQVIFFRISCLPELENTPWRDVHAHIRPNLVWHWKKKKEER